MDSLTSLLFIGIGVVVMFLSSFIAKLLKAKRYQFYWMVIPWLLSVVAIIATNIFQYDGLYAIAAGLVVFILSIEIIVGMGFVSALTVTITSFAILIAASAGGLYALKKSGSEIEPITTSVISLIPESQYYNMGSFQVAKHHDDLLVDDLVMDDYTDLDLLPNKVVQKPIIESRVYREINPLNAGSMIGAMIRLLKTDGTVVKGNIVGFSGSKITISKYISKKGMIKAPIAISSIRKLEVMGH